MTCNQLDKTTAICIKKKKESHIITITILYTNTSKYSKEKQYNH